MPADVAARSFTLENGLEVRYASTEDEARYIYAENFEDAQYLKNGIVLEGGGLVIDVGANTGMFAIFAAQCVGATGRVIAFEPEPAVHACAEANAAAHAAWAAARGDAAPAPVEVRREACGDGSCDELTMTVYDNLSAINTLVPDHEDAVTILKSFIETQIMEGKAVGNVVQRTLAQGLGRPLMLHSWTHPFVSFVVDKIARSMLLARHTVACRMTTLSDVMAEEGVGRVALLKVDVERAELSVLQGVAKADWARIDQAAVEAHAENKEPVLRLLKEVAGFTRVAAAPADPVLGPGLWMIHATRQ